MVTETNTLALEPARGGYLRATLPVTLPIGAAIGMAILCFVLAWLTDPNIVPGLEHEPGEGAFDDAAIS